MGIDWTITIIAVITIGATAGVLSEFIKARAKAGEDAARAALSEQFQKLAGDYENLVREIRENQASSLVVLLELSKKMETIEKILKTVG